MSQWVINGIRRGIKTTAYPSRTEGAAGVTPGQDVEVEARREDGTALTFRAMLRVDEAAEVEYLRAGGVLRFVLRQILQG